ncbi:MAG: autotransporter domain-containing protein, partial [Endomicrobia bacterium]|nr:autotransporter domain-containing protein [Endomicrobiia bacterium]
YNAGGGITFSSNAYITGNKTQFGSGGAIYSAGGAITFFNAIELVRNASGDAGGAIYVSSGAVSFLSSAGIFGNSAYGHGGAIYGGQGGSFSFQSETDFTENKSLLGAGGAIYKLMSSAADGITFNQSVSFTTNTAALGGGAIYSSGRGLVTFNNSASFRGNSVTDESSQLSAGGAIYADSIIYRFYGNAVFEQNSAALSRGGAIYAQASTFTFSSAASFYANIVKGANLEGGAAIYSVGSYFDFQSDATIFSGNKTSEDTQVSGGAIYALYSNYKFKQAVFTDNSATDKGGAIALIDCDTVFTGNVRFERNSAAAGGALYLGHLAGSSNLVNFNGQVLFQYNNSLKWNLIGGGAILLNASTGSLQINFAQIASFNYNESAANGGAFTIYSGAQNTINFSGVTNFDDNAAAANGGAFYSLIYGTGKGEYNFTNSGYFADNTAGNSGGAIFAHGNNKFTIDSSFYFGSNFAGGTDANGGGAIFSSLSTFTFSGSQAVEFEYNEASSRGGAVYQENGLFDFQSSADFKFNSAGVSGGAVYASYGAMTFNRSVSFTSNTASGDLLTSGGGALYAFEQTLRFLANTNFENNSAKGITNGSGGAIYASKSNLSFTGTGTASFSNNEALFRGGAFYQNEGTSVFKSIPAIFTNNVAGSEGGAVYLAGKGTIEFTNAQFISNSAGVNGGAIYIKGASSSNISEIYFNQTVSALTLFNANTANGFANSMHFAGNSYVEFTVLQNQTLNVNDGFTAAGRNNLVTLKGGGTFNMNDNISGFESLNLNLDNISFNLADGKNMSLNNLSVLNGSVLNMQQSFDGQTVSVSGDLTLDYMSELRLCVISGGDCDVIDVGGKAFLDGTVSVKAGVGTYDNEWFTLINAADGFEDTDFAVKFLDDSGIHQTDPCPLKYTFEFDETQKRFMLVINGIRQSYFSQLDGLGRNQKNAAAMYDALSANASRPLANVINSITDMSTVSQQAALLETAPYFIANALNYRLHNRSKRDLFNNIEKSDKTNNIWAYADGGGSLVFQSDINSPGDFETADYGAVFGADKKLSPDFILGFYGKYNIANISQGKSEGNIASYGLGTYALANKDAWQFKAALGYEGQSYDITRSIVNVGSDTIRSAKTEFNSYLLEADIEASYDIPVSKVFSLSPFAGINGSWAHYGSFDETGADVLSLEIEGSNSFVTNTRLGISANMKVSSKLDLRLSAEYDRLFSGYLPELNVKLNGETEVFETVGSETGRDIFGFNLYASYNINENVKTYASGTIKTAQNLSSLGGTLGVKYSF